MYDGLFYGHFSASGGERPGQTIAVMDMHPRLGMGQIETGLPFVLRVPGSDRCGVEISFPRRR